MDFKHICPGVPQNSVRDTKYPGSYKSHKCDISDNAYEHFDFPTMGENIYWNSRRQMRWVIKLAGVT
jgi:hypothetical protein